MQKWTSPSNSTRKTTLYRLIFSSVRSQIRSGSENADTVKPVTFEASHCEVGLNLPCGNEGKRLGAPKSSPNPSYFALGTDGVVHHMPRCWGQKTPKETKRTPLKLYQASRIPPQTHRKPRQKPGRNEIVFRCVSLLNAFVSLSC